MNIQKLTQKSIEAVNRAQSIATERENRQLEQAHILLALVEQDGGIAGELIKKCGADASALAARLEDVISTYPKVSGDGGMYLSQSADKALNEAEKLAVRMGDEYISVEHILMGIVDVADKDIKALLRYFDLEKILINKINQMNKMDNSNKTEE